MKCYLDITLLHDADISLYFLWEKVYQQLHLCLVESKNSDGKVSVAVSFPEYDDEKYHLGSKLRIMAPSNEELEGLKLQQWMSQLSDYIHITKIREIVPERIQGYVCFKRIQLKSNNTRLARRKAKREGISYEQALSHFEGCKEEYSRAPFIQIKSHSSGKRYRLIIARDEAENAQAIKGFSTYGLSTESTVPLF